MSKMFLEAYMQSQSPELNLEVIKATAGAGKTQTLIDEVIRRVLNFYEQNHSFPRTAIATFTRKATSEMKERLIVKAIEQKHKQLIEYISYSHQLQISTIHGIFYRFLQMHSIQAGLSPGFVITSEKQSQQLFIAALKEQLFEKKIGIQLLDHYYFYELQKIVRQYIAYVQEYPASRPFNHQELENTCAEKEKLILSDKIPQKTLKKDDLEKCQLNKQYSKQFADLSLQLKILGEAVLNSWKQKKKQTSQITLADLEIMICDLINNKKINSSIFKNHWDLWFIDEYQDTSVVQNKILDVLTQGSRVFIVGDPQQSIYRFRRADPSVFLNKQIAAEQSQTGRLLDRVQNFRSEPELVAFFNDFFVKCENMKPQDQHYRSEKEVAQFIQVSPSNQSRSNQDQKLQAQFHEVANRLKVLFSQGESPGNIAVLARKNDIISKLGRFLKDRKFSIHLHSSGHFANSREIKDALLLLRFFCNPYHDVNLIGLLRSPYWRVPDQILVEWMEEVKKLSNKQVIMRLWQVCLSKQKKYPVITVLNNYLKEAAVKGIVYSFQRAIESSGLMDLSYYQDPTGLKEANLWKLIYQLKKHELIAGMGSVGMENSEGYMESSEGYWLSFIDSLLEEDIADRGFDFMQPAVSAIASSGVQLMTIHAAKGLQFDHVILLDLYRRFQSQPGTKYFLGEIPSTDVEDVTNEKRIKQEMCSKSRWAVHIRSETEDKRIQPLVHEKILATQKEEELREMDRLLYVALTRAKKTVTLIGAGNKPENNSWADRSKFFNKYVTKEGCYHTPHYTYRVRIC